MKGSFGHNEAQKPSMTRVGDKKKSMAKKMADRNRAFDESVKRDTEVGWNKGKPMSDAAHKSFRRHLDKLHGRAY